MNKDVLLLCLNKEGSLVSDMGQVGLDIDLPLGPQLLQHCVDDNVGPRSANTYTAVDE